MRRIKQRTDDGCAVACLAMVTGSPLWLCERMLATTGAASFDELRRVLKALGHKARLIKGDYRRTSLAIVGFDWPADYGKGCHCVVWCEGRYYDPDLPN